jgi:hypothetical protein
MTLGVSGDREQTGTSSLSLLLFGPFLRPPARHRGGLLRLILHGTGFCSAFEIVVGHLQVVLGRDPLPGCPGGLRSPRRNPAENPLDGTIQ